MSVVCTMARFLPISPVGLRSPLRTRLMTWITPRPNVRSPDEWAVRAFLRAELSAHSQALFVPQDRVRPVEIRLERPVVGVAGADRVDHSAAGWWRTRNRPVARSGALATRRDRRASPACSFR